MFDPWEIALVVGTWFLGLAALVVSALAYRRDSRRSRRAIYLVLLRKLGEALRCVEAARNLLLTTQVKLARSDPARFKSQLSSPEGKKDAFGILCAEAEEFSGVPADARTKGYVAWFDLPDDPNSRMVVESLSKITAHLNQLMEDVDNNLDSALMAGAPSIVFNPATRIKLSFMRAMIPLFVEGPTSSQPNLSELETSISTLRMAMAKDLGTNPEKIIILDVDEKGRASQIAR